MKVRLLRSEDIIKVVPLATEYLEETLAYKHTGFDPSVLIRNILAVTESASSSECIFVVEKDSELLGFLWGVVGDATPWTTSKMGMDRVLYVKQEARGLAGVRLIKAYERWATAEGADSIILSSVSGIADSRTEALYERLGFSKSGFVKIKHLN